MGVHLAVLRCLLCTAGAGEKMLCGSLFGDAVPETTRRPATSWRAVSFRERLAGVDHSGIQIGPSQKPHALWPLSQTGFTH